MAIAVDAGTISLKKVIALLVPANTFTLQKLTRKYTTTSAAAMERPGRGELALAMRGVHIQPLRPGPGPGAHVLHRRLGFHRDHRDDGDPRGPARQEPHQRAVRVVAVAHGTAGFREHGAQFGIGQCDEQDDHRADDPRIDRAGTGQLGGAPRAEQPARADDRAQAGEHQRDGADFAPDRSFIGHQIPHRAQATRTDTQDTLG